VKKEEGTVQERDGNPAPVKTENLSGGLFTMWAKTETE
jgi:hypothetical protein